MCCLSVIQESFDNVGIWLQEVDRYSSEDVIKVLVGNKCDLTSRRIVDYASARVGIYFLRVKLPLSEYSFFFSDITCYCFVFVFSRMSTLRVRKTHVFESVKPDPRLKGRVRYC